MEHKSMLDETYQLSNGVKIPKLGLGTWMIPETQASEAVRAAIKLGYRHIDTAEAYGNERGVGEGIRTCGIAREKLFVTTKLAAEIKEYKAAKAAIAESLAKLDISYIDMMIIHCPQPWDKFRNGEHYFEGNLEAWRALEEAHQAGHIRAIGVSNFEEADVDNILEHGTVKPVVNQILCHVGNTPAALIDYCKAHDILVEAYSPIAHGEMLKNQNVQAMAKKYGVTISRLCVRYCLQLGTVALPKTTNPEHMKDNADVAFEIEAEDMEILKNAERLKDYGEYSYFPVFSGKQ